MSDWRDRAACRDKDPELWFPVSAIGPDLLKAKRAKEVCDGCPVRDFCLAFALDARIDHGIWGGLDEDERRVLVGRRPRRSGAPRGRPPKAPAKAA